MPDSDAQKWLNDNPAVESVVAAIVDLNGAWRGKRIPVSEASKVFDGSLRLPLSVCGVDVWGEDVEESDLVFETGDADGICSVTERGILPVSWLPKPTALVPVWMSQEDGAPFLGDPRRTLAAVKEKLETMGLKAVVATELEFYLFDPSEDRPQPPCSPVTGKRLSSDGVLSVDELEHFEAFIGDVYQACGEQNIPADTAISENGAGQFEINMKHVGDPMKAADDAIFFKKIVHGVARKHGLAATFMAKPYGNRAGNGFHVHFSILDKDGKNIFDNGGEEGTEALKHVVAGLLSSMRDFSIIWAPHANSYRRLLPGSHAPSSVCWGYENRTASIRIPGGSPVARRVEHRVAGADANPYLVLAAILGGAVLGLENKMKPPAPITGDAYSQKLPHLCPDWASAIEAFESCTTAASIFPPLLQRMLVDCKRQELKRFNRHVTDLEYSTYLETV